MMPDTVFESGPDSGLVLVADEDALVVAQWAEIPDLEAVIQVAVATVEQAFDAPQIGWGEVAVLLTCDAHMKALNANFRDQDKATNVLSFPDDEPGRLGDIALALETVQREARTEEKPFRAHLSHLVIHGVLHLMGYDHISEDEADEMEAIEIELLAGLGFANPYETPSETTEAA